MKILNKTHVFTFATLPSEYYCQLKNIIQSNYHKTIFLPRPNCWG